MKKIYEYLLTTDYNLEHYYSEKSFCFKKEIGDWCKTIYISKYGKEYTIETMEGYSNMIKTAKYTLKLYKEVIELIKSL